MFYNMIIIIIYLYHRHCYYDIAEHSHIHTQKNSTWPHVKWCKMYAEETKSIRSVMRTNISYVQ